MHTSGTPPHTRHCPLNINDILDACGLAIRVRAGFNGIGKVHDYHFRFEYQGRGALHVHVVAWMDYALPQDWHSGFESLSGKPLPTSTSAGSPRISRTPGPAARPTACLATARLAVAPWSSRQVCGSA